MLQALVYQKELVTDFLYKDNLRFAFNTCIFGTTNASDSLSTPCSSSTVCEPLRKALSDGMGTPLTTSQYSYCSAYDNSFLGSNLDTCRDCLRFNSNAFYLSNCTVHLIYRNDALTDCPQFSQHYKRAVPSAHLLDLQLV